MGPPDFIPHPSDGLSYKLYDGVSENLLEAMKTCQESGAELATFKSHREYDAVKSYLGVCTHHIVNYLPLSINKEKSLML